MFSSFRVVNHPPPPPTVSKANCPTIWPLARDFGFCGNLRFSGFWLDISGLFGKTSPARVRISCFLQNFIHFHEMVEHVCDLLDIKTWKSKCLRFLRAFPYLISSSNQLLKCDMSSKLTKNFCGQIWTPYFVIEKKQFLFYFDTLSHIIAGYTQTHTHKHTHKHTHTHTSREKYLEGGLNGGKSS